jgi:hypothetical protein
MRDYRSRKTAELNELLENLAIIEQQVGVLYIKGN